MRGSSLRFKLLAIITVCAFISGCMPKYNINYSVAKQDVPIKFMSGKKLGVLCFDDTRSSDDKEGRATNNETFAFSDKFFEKPVVDIVTDNLINYIKDANPDHHVVRLEPANKDLDIDKLQAFNDSKLADYVLLGSVSNFKGAVYDEHFGARNAVSFILGLTIVGIVFFPLVLVGDIDISSSIGVDNLLLVDTSGPQILWRGKCIQSDKRPIPLVSDGTEEREKILSETMSKTMQCVYNNLNLASDLGFPNKMNVDDSKKVIKHMKANGGLAGLAF